jgi:glc operon protein GlcG
MRAISTLASATLMALPLRVAFAQTDESRVIYLSHEQVQASFATGSPLLEVRDYKIHASRRESMPGLAEIHTRDTDIIYVLQGSATLVTGGRTVAAKETGPEELRGSAIEGGETREITVGDVVVVPNGTPHWFKRVSGPLLYYVVKVRQASRGAATGAVR